jgi:hypothetical protein
VCVCVCVCVGIFHLTTASRTVLGPTQPPIQWVSEALSLGVKRPEREYDHSLPSSAEVNAWSYISTPQYAFMAFRDNFKMANDRRKILHLAQDTDHWRALVTMIMYLGVP